MIGKAGKVKEMEKGHFKGNLPASSILQGNDIWSYISSLIPDYIIGTKMIPYGDSNLY